MFAIDKSSRVFKNLLAFTFLQLILIIIFDFSLITAGKEKTGLKLVFLLFSDSKYY